jgi:CDP-glucose 4,6-dehydratase
MDPLRDFYNRKRILLTGHTGFKGSWLALILAELGAEVHGYALAPDTTPNLFTEAAVASRLAAHHIADIRDLGTLTKVARDVQPEIVFHLAAQPIVLRSYREPRETYEINVMGTVNLLEAVRATHSVRVCQVVTSDKCYENREWVYPYREADPMGGSDPYSNSKGCAELVVAAYRKSFFPPTDIPGHGVSLSSARAGNVIGGGDWAEARIIPDCIRALERNEPIPVREPDAVRPWQHVLEPLAGYLQLAAAQWDEPAKFAEPWNFGPLPGSQVAVRTVVDQTIREWGAGSWQHVRPPANDPKIAGTKKESFLLKLDITKSLTLLGWLPKWDLPTTIHQTISWYRKRAQTPTIFDAHAACVAQIRNYFGSP